MMATTIVILILLFVCLKWIKSIERANKQVDDEIKLNKKKEKKMTTNELIAHVKLAIDSMKSNIFKVLFYRKFIAATQVPREQIVNVMYKLYNDVSMLILTYRQN